jgi:multiple sugar transport system substrate-binding protein
MISKRRILAMKAGLAALMLTAASQASAQTTITFRFNDPEAPQMRQALDEFEKLNPDIKVTMQRVSWGDAQAQFLREAAVGQAPDVAQIAFVWPRAFGRAGALRPLDDLIAKTNVGVGGWEKFVSKDLATGADGKTYAIPFTTDTFAVMYNKDLVKAAGFDSFPTTWAGLKELSKAVQAKTGKAGFGFPAGTCGTPTIWFLTNFYIWSKGWAFIDDAGDGKFKVAITPEQLAEAFSYYKSYLDEGHNPKANLSICLWGAPELVEGMVNGSIAFVSVPDAVGVQIAETFKQRNPGKESPFAAAPHPADVNGSKTFFGGRMLAISANSKNVDAGWKLIRFLTTPEPTFTKYYTNYVQPQESVMNYNRLPPEIAPGFSAQIKTARSWGPYATGPVAIPFMWNAVGRAAGSVFIGEKTSAQAAQEVIAAISGELAKNQK